jgi:hypothetical protein
MAHDLTTIMPKILARGLMTLRERCVMPRLVNSDYGTDARKKGSTIDVEVPVSVATQDVAPGVTKPQGSDKTPTVVQIALDNWKQNDPIFLTDKNLLEIDSKNNFLPSQMTEAVKALANDVNQSIFAKYKGVLRGVYGVTGTAGTTPFGTGVEVKSATQSRKILNQQLTPKTDRRGVLDFDAEAAALELSAFSDAEKIMSAAVKLEGEVGRKFGIDWVADDHVPTHTAGTIVDGLAGRTMAVDNAAGYAAGSTAIDLDQGAATTAVGTIVVGDIVSFAGHSQTYTVIANTASAQYSSVNEEYTAATNAIAGLGIYPALTMAVADDEVMTVQDDHVVNLVFHRDAFAFANRPLQDLDVNLGQMGGGQILSMQDPVTGIVLRLEVSRQHKQVAWEFDILWGCELVRPQLAVRLLG